MIAFVIISLLTLAGLAMLAILDTNGEVTVVSARTGTKGVAIGEAIASPTLPTSNYGTLATDLLGSYTEAAVVVVDLKTRRVYATSDSVKQAAMLAVIDATVGLEVQFTPDANQSGTLLTFTASGDVAEDGMDAASAVVATAKPRKTAGSLLTAALTAFAAKKDTAFDPDALVAVIDQTNGKVILSTDTNPGTISAGLAAISPGTTDMVCVELSEAPAPASESALVFEKGWQG